MSPLQEQPDQAPKPGRYFSSSVPDELDDFETKAARCIESMVQRVGLPNTVIPEAVERELLRTFSRAAFDDLERLGFGTKGAVIIDIGAGLGSASAEAASRGAVPLAVEPGVGWRELAAERIRAEGRGSVVAAIGESLPFLSNTADIVISLMVLEHVADPQMAIKEAFRVLKPGGVCYLACENYLSFYEPHYRLAWLPMLPKPIGALYLRLRGRPPEFLRESITYVTRLSVRRMLGDTGFVFLRRRHLEDVVASVDGLDSSLKHRAVASAKRLVGARVVVDAAFHFQDLRTLCVGPIVEIVQKPSSTAGSA